MGRILSQEEIDALLLSPVAAGRHNYRDGLGSEESLRYNFHRPDRVSKEEIQSVRLLHDRFARNVATSLSVYLRTVAEVSVVSVEQFVYSEFLMSLADPTAFYALSIPPVEELGALEINPSLAFALIERSLGGAALTVEPPPARALTDIEQHVVDRTVRLLLEALGDAWRQVAEVSFEIKARETRPQMLQVAAPNETVVMVGFEVALGATRGTINLCLPVNLIEATEGALVQAWRRQHRDPTESERTHVEQHLLALEVPVTASVRSTVNSGDLRALHVGDTLALGVPSTHAVTLSIGRHDKYKARLLAVDGRVVVKVEEPYVEEVA